MDIMMTYFTFRLSRLFVTVVGITLFLSACKKKVIDTPPSPQGPGIDYLEIKWSAPFVDPNMGWSIVSPPKLSNGRVLLVSEYSIAPHTASSLLFFDTATGNIVDSWNDYIDGPDYYNSHSMKLKKGNLFLSRNNSVDCINTATGETKWGSMFNDGPARIYPIGERVYKVSRENIFKCKVEYVNIESGSKTDLFEFERVDKWKPLFGGLVSTVSSNGDQLLLWKNSGWNGTTEDRADIFCYSLTNDSLMWISSEKFFVNAGFIDSKTSGDFMYTILSDEVISIDVNSGQINWKRELNNCSEPSLTFSGWDGDIHISGNRLIIVTDGCPDVVVLDRFTGQLVRQWDMRAYTNYSAQWTSSFVHWEDKLFYTNGGRLQVLDDHSGEPLLEKNRMLHLGSVGDGVAIDSLTKSIYVTTGRELVCLRIPDDLR